MVVNLVELFEGVLSVDVHGWCRRVSGRTAAGLSSLMHNRRAHYSYRSDAMTAKEEMPYESMAEFDISDLLDSDGNPPAAMAPQDIEHLYARWHKLVVEGVVGLLGEPSDRYYLEPNGKRSEYLVLDGPCYEVIVGRYGVCLMWNECISSAVRNNRIDSLLS